MMEQMVLFQKNRFGRSSEKMAASEQIRFMEVDGTIVFFNEAEAVCDLDVPEPDDLELKAPKKKKQPGKKAADIAGLTVKRIDHYLKEEELTAEFGENGWKQLPDAISRCYQFIPASVVIEEHHIGVYSSKLDEHMIKAPHPRNLLHGSLVSPSLAAAVINGKYVNAVPLYRLEKGFERYGLAITRQSMANWMIRLGEEYLGRTTYAVSFLITPSSRTEKCTASIKTIGYTDDNGRFCHSSILGRSLSVISDTIPSLTSNP